MNTSGHSEIVERQTLNQKMPDQEIREVAKPDQTRLKRKSGSSLTRKPEASDVGHKKKRAKSDKQSAPPPVKRKLTPVPSDPETLRAQGLPSILRKYRNLPAYTADGDGMAMWNLLMNI